MKVLIDNGHGEDTPGKRSPDGKFREYRFARNLADSLMTALNAKGIDSRLIVPEENDVSLKERCTRINKLCDEYGANNCILVSIHVNAAGNGTNWCKASGWQVHTTIGETKSDQLAECLYDAAEKHLKGKKIRVDNSDGDRDWENDFYILKHSKCPAVLVENFFQDCKEDVEYLESEEGFKSILLTHLDGIMKYIECKK